MANFAELEHVDNALSREVASMSASTMDRALKGLKRVGPGSVRKNRRSGKDDPATYFTCCPGGKGIAAEAEPGHLQVDTVALCGGDMRGNFLWIITLTDRKTQRTEIYPVWDKGAEEVLDAMGIPVKRFPFKTLSLHYDNGREFLNGHRAAFVPPRRSASSVRAPTARTTTRTWSKRTGRSSGGSSERRAPTPSSSGASRPRPAPSGPTTSTTAGRAS